MPEESINNFINSTMVLVIFTAVVIAVFLLFLLISRLMVLSARRRSNRENGGTGLIDYERSFSGRQTVFTSSAVIKFRKDPFIKKNSMAIGITFSLFMLSVLIIFLAFYIIGNLTVGPSLYLLIGLFFILFASCVYIVKSKTLD